MVFETVRRARHRILANEALRHAAYAASAALASLIVLLLLGTQILGWPWLLLLPAAALAAGAYTTWRRAPSAYRVAQRLDHNLRLADALSTAVFFAQSGSVDRGGDMRRAQWSQAESIAAGVDPRRAIPLRMPRALYAAALLALAAGSLFALRYGLARRLDLRPPLARMLQDKLGYTETRQAARDRQKPAVHDPKRPEDAGFSLDEAGQKAPGELDAAPDSALDTVGEPDAVNQTGASRPESAKAAKSTPLEGEQNQGEEAEGVSANPGDQQSADGRKGPSAGKPGKQGQGDGQQEAAANSNENSSLLGKFRDAMSSLMNRVRQQAGAQGAQQAGAQKGQQKSQSGNNGQNGKQGQQPGDGQQADAKDGQPGDDSESAQSAQPGSPGESGQQPATKQPGSGIGRQDGSKDVKLAEQLAAMGKISEIIGKRAANVTGELTVEVENSNQQLRTPYAQRDAHHAEAGGEIHRDEVPVGLQAYVQQYFEQVRKQAARQQRTEPAKQTKPGL
jgi:hypothetical protein